MKKKTKKRGFLDGYKTYDTSQGYGSPSEWKACFNRRMSREEAEEILGDSNPLKILGLSPGFTMEQLKKAYRRLVMQWHPDICKKENAEEMFIRIHAAYVKLGGV